MKSDISDMLTHLIKDEFGGTKYTQYTLAQMKERIETYITSETKTRNIKTGCAEYNKVRRLIQKSKSAKNKEELLTFLTETLLTIGGLSA